MRYRIALLVGLASGLACPTARCEDVAEMIDQIRKADEAENRKKVVNDLNMRNRARAYELGWGEKYDRREEQLKRFGHPDDVTFLMHPDDPGRVVDEAAWRTSFFVRDKVVVVGCVLDPVRYGNVLLKHKPEVRLINKKAAAATKGTAIVPRHVKGAVYEIVLPLPPSALADYIIAISAEVEEGWTGRAVVDLAQAEDVILEAETYDVEKVTTAPMAKAKKPATLPVGDSRPLVIMQYVIAPDGRVDRFKVVIYSSAAALEAASNAVKQWVFQPAMVDGKPVRVRVQESIPFE